MTHHPGPVGTGPNPTIVFQLSERFRIPSAVVGTVIIENNVEIPHILQYGIDSVAVYQPRISVNTRYDKWCDNSERNN